MQHEEGSEFFLKKVVIVGTGIIGATTAYELARNGIEVTMVDRHAKGRATSAAAGIVCPWITKRRNKAWYELAKKGAAYLENLIQHLNVDGEYETGYKKIGAIRLHTDKSKLEDLEKIAIKRQEMAPQMGNISLLSVEKTQEKFPFLNGTYHSLFIEGAARVDGRALRQSLIKAAKKHGATYLEGEAKLIHYGNEVTGVSVGKDTIQADVTIATNGVWMPKLLEPLDVKLHILAQKGEIIHLKTKGIDTSSLPVVMPPNNQYLLSFDHGKIVIGATHTNNIDFNTQITAGGIHYILDQALKVAPELDKCMIAETRVGFRPFTFNHLPIFGSIPPLKQLLIANGLGASGLTTGPFIGNQLAKIVMDNELDVELKNYHVVQALK